MKRLWNTIAGLRLGFEEHFRGAGSIIGRGLRRAAGKAEAGDGGHADTSAGDELSAGVFSHFPLPCGRCLRAGLMSGEDVA